MVIPEGNYMVLGACDFSHTNDSASGECNADIYVDGVARLAYGQTMLNGDTYSSCCISLCGLLSVPKGDTRKLILRTSVNWPARGTFTTKAQQAWMIATQISKYEAFTGMN